MWNITEEVSTTLAGEACYNKKIKVHVIIKQRIIGEVAHSD